MQHVYIRSILIKHNLGFVINVMSYFYFILTNVAKICRVYTSENVYIRLTTSSSSKWAEGYGMVIGDMIAGKINILNKPTYTQLHHNVV